MCGGRPGGEALGSYRLIEVLRFRLGTHYINDMLDPRGSGPWVRFDGMHNGGAGERVDEQGAGRVRHGGGSYFPVLVAYARCE